MRSMSDFDHSDLDAATAAAAGRRGRDAARSPARRRALGVTQSAVSHLLDKLRAIVGDPLFVKSGRGIRRHRARGGAGAAGARTAERARALRRAARISIRRAGARTSSSPPTTCSATRCCRGLAARLRASRRRGVTLGIMPSNVPTAEMLRREHCRLIVSPRPPEGADIVQKRCSRTAIGCSTMPPARAAPKGRAEYLAADHVTRRLRTAPHARSRRPSRGAGVRRRFVVTVPGFAGVPAFLRGSDLLATAPGLLRFGLLQGFASVPPPIPCPTLPMYMIWSRRDHDDPASAGCAASWKRRRSRWRRGRARGHSPAGMAALRSR